MFHQGGTNVANEREKLLEEIEDIQYTTFWGVAVDPDGSISDVELRYVMEFPQSSLVQDFKPSEAFIRNAKKQIKNMDWHHAEVEQTVICYLLKSNPDEPQCTNNLER